MADGSINIDVGSDYSVQDEVWNFKLKATSVESTMDPNNIVEYEFAVTLKDGCLMNELTNPNDIDDIDYYIAATGPYVVPTPTYTQLVDNCAISWTLVSIDPDSGDEQALTPTQA